MCSDYDLFDAFLKTRSFCYAQLQKCSCGFIFLLFPVYSLIRRNHMRIIFIIGSLRRNSFNRALAENAAAIIGERAEISFLEYQDIPYMNQDIEYPAPESIRRIREEIMSADGIWIFSPEYNFSIPGVLKNLLDWLSRPLVKGDAERVSAVTGIPVTLSGAGGRSGASNARKRLSELSIFMKMKHMDGPETSIILSPEEFASDTLSLSEEEKKVLRDQAERFLSFIDA